MAIGIIRARNVGAGSIGDIEAHNNREFEKGKYPENIREGGEFTRHLQDDQETSLQEVIDQRIRNEEVQGIRKNTNVAIEYVATINDPKVWERYSPSGFFHNTKKWLEDRHGKGSVVASYHHMDESNPHAHYVVVPVKEKEVKWKNQKGEGSRIEKRLNTREFTGGREKLRQLQDDYFQYLKGYGDKLGVPIYRGTKVEHQKKRYIRETDHKIGQMRAKLATLSNSLEIEEQKLAIKKERLKIAETKLELVEHKEAKKADKNKWKRKGTMYNKEIFHENKEQEKGKGKKGGKGGGMSM
jgi:hypothetical protein